MKNHRQFLHREIAPTITLYVVDIERLGDSRCRRTVLRLATNEDESSLEYIPEKWQAERFDEYSEWALA